MGISIGANGTAFFGVSISIGFFWDDHGNFDWQWSYSVPGVNETASVGLLDVGASVGFQYTNADTVYDLHGPATYIGVSGGPSWYVGGDLISFEDASDLEGDIDGFQLVGGIGLGYDIHITETYTKPLVNRQDVAYKILTFKEKRLSAR